MVEKFTRDSWLRALSRTQNIATAGQTLPELMRELAAKHGGALALQDQTHSMSFEALGERIGAYAHLALNQGLRPGDCVALFMGNCIEYPAIWLGLTRIGVSVALINSQLSGAVLAHSINAVKPRLLIADSGRVAHFLAIRELLPTRVPHYVHDPADPKRENALTANPVGSEAALPPAPAMEDTALFIYTSGTTGMPKAARVSHLRVMRWCQWFAGLLDTCPADRMFNCLPMYHSIGGVVATFATLVSGGSVLIRPKFSASEFWPDVVEHGCTLFQYIGELCRYLVNSPTHPEEHEHRLRLACGNGLRAEVWEPFQRRFRIPRILEYYASTEGNFSLYNCEGKVGSIGRIPPFVSSHSHVALLRFDPERGEPVRDAQGRCEPCGVDEVGEAAGLVSASGAGRFEGYTDQAASASKVLRDVFRTGDSWFRTGDLMRKDAQGFFYFVDRIGDTFRWRGENVSSSEVLGQLEATGGLLEAVVYGVAVPGYEGRAGMAAIVVDEHFELPSFRGALSARLPSYARPQFVRLKRSLSVTGTYKVNKQQLLEEGFDPERVTDPLFVNDERANLYVPLDRTLYEAILNGSFRL